MTSEIVHAPDPELDLVLERRVEVPPALVWKAWTEPEHLVKWFTPKPWRTIECQIDLRPGGIFRTVMASPEGEEFPNAGCYLEVVEGRRLVWTDSLGPGFRPKDLSSGTRESCGITAMTAALTLEPEGGGTRYVAMALHASAAEREAHEKMGFHDGWGAALDQLVELARTW